MTPLLSRILRSLALAPLLALAGVTAQAQTTTLCGAEVTEEVAKQLALNAKLSEADQLALQAKLYEQFSYCANDAKNVPPDDNFYVAARQCSAAATYIGSLYYEEMPCCGYDPQRRAFACPVKIKQNFGFGTAPNPGSREYVMHCVNAGNGFMPVGQDHVHLANATSAPPWQFGVITHAVDNVQTVQPMTGATRTARSILSWNLKPTNCDYKPIWGNVIEYRIRLNQ